MEVRDLFESMDYGAAPEADDRARAWLEERKGVLDHYIAGRWRTPESGEYFQTRNPSGGELLAMVADGNEADVNRAVAAAADALEGWVAIGGHGRARYLYAMARHIQKNGRLFSVLESLDNGKPIRESRDVDIPLVARHFYHHAGWAQVMRERLPAFRPIGVVGQIIPWNFPLLMLAWKVAPALAMGNTVVLKPAEFTPATAVLFAEMCSEVGLPPGVFNVVLGDHKAGQALAAHKGIGKLAFTGSTEVGRILRRVTAGTGKKLTLELGGKSPFIVFEDTDIDSAVEKAQKMAAEPSEAESDPDTSAVRTEAHEPVERGPEPPPDADETDEEPDTVAEPFEPPADQPHDAAPSTFEDESSMADTSPIDPPAETSTSPQTVVGSGLELSDEDVDRIARRVVELASNRLDQIAWEIVPELAEMLINRKLEEIQALKDKLDS